MSNLTLFPDLALAREQAAEWIARIDRGLSTAEKEELRRWCASPANARALQEMSTLWQELDLMKVLADVFPQPQHLRTQAPRRAGRRAALTAAAAALLAIPAIGIFLLLREGPSPAPVIAEARVAAFVTAVGEQRIVPLDDGSVLSLNTDSQVEVALGGQSRELRLLRGEVHFTVAHDAARPFRVNADGRVVQAIGTAFDVRRHGRDDIEVIVTEGRVKVLPPSGPATERLDRGQALRIRPDGSSQMTELDSGALASRLSWRNGMLLFDGQTLESALAEFSRYTADRLVLTDENLGGLRVGGYFPAGDTEALLEALRTSFGLAVHRSEDGVIRIGPAGTLPARAGE